MKRFLLTSIFLLLWGSLAYADDFFGVSDGMSGCDTSGSNYELDVVIEDGYEPSEGSADGLQCDSSNTDMYGNSLCD